MPTTAELIAQTQALIERAKAAARVTAEENARQYVIEDGDRWMGQLAAFMAQVFHEVTFTRTSMSGIPENLRIPVPTYLQNEAEIVKTAVELFVNWLALPRDLGVYGRPQGLLVKPTDQQKRKWVKASRALSNADLENWLVTVGNRAAGI